MVALAIMNSEYYMVYLYVKRLWRTCTILFLFILLMTLWRNLLLKN